MSKESNKLHLLLIYLLLGLITFIAFEQVRHNDFVDYDDGVYVTENPNILTGLTLENIKWAFTTNYNTNWHPLTWLSHMLDCQLFGPNPSWHHLSSLLLHIANAMLLFAILNSMTATIWPSVFAAAVFALHPLHVESVAWASERKDVLSTLFWMLTMLAYLGYVRKPNAARYLLTLLAFALGLMAKPMLVTLPFVLLLLDYWPLNRIENISLVQPSSRQTIVRLVFEKIPFFIFSTLSSVITFLAQRAGQAVVPLDVLPFHLRLINAVIACARYLGKILWPADLAIFYPINKAELTYGRVLAALALLLAASFIVLKLTRRRRYLPTGWFWFLGTLVPVIGIVQVGGQALADRYTYIPSIGIFIILAFGTAELLKNWKYRKPALSIIASAIILVLLIQTRTQVSYWQNSISLFEHTLAVTKNNATMHYNLGYVYHLQNNIDKAAHHYREALRINPQDADSHNNLGVILRDRNNLDEAVEHFRKTVEINPSFAPAYYNLGRVLRSQGKFDEAIKYLNINLQLQPDRPEIYDTLAAAYIEADPNSVNPANAAEALILALYACEATNHSNPLFLDTLATAYAVAGNLPQAIETLETALKLAKTAGDEELAEQLYHRQQIFELALPFNEK